MEVLAFTTAITIITLAIVTTIAHIILVMLP